MAECCYWIEAQTLLAGFFDQGSLKVKNLQLHSPDKFTREQSSASLQRATVGLGNPLRFMSTDEVVSVMLNLMEDVSREELFENPVILFSHFPYWSVGCSCGRVGRCVDDIGWMV